jgi:hypothetical protein
MPIGGKNRDSRTVSESPFYTPEEMKLASADEDGIEEPSPGNAQRKKGVLRRGGRFPPSGLTCDRIESSLGIQNPMQAAELLTCVGSIWEPEFQCYHAVSTEVSRLLYAVYRESAQPGRSCVTLSLRNKRGVLS